MPDDNEARDEAVTQTGIAVAARAGSTVTLDRAQRDAIRFNVATWTNGWGDIHIYTLDGDREHVRKARWELGRMIALMDAIGWTEQPDTPDEQPVSRSRSLAAFARREAKSLLRVFDDCDGANDELLDAYRALCALGVPEAV
jgi:hypothetical protein